MHACLAPSTMVDPLNITSTVFGAGGGTGVLTYHLPSFHPCLLLRTSDI